MTCPVTGCPLEATGLGLCRGHFRQVPRPAQAEIYQLVKRHQGGPAHQQAIRRACLAVNRVREGRPPQAQATPAWLPYRDD